jgi:hypothetical protein
LPQPSSRRANSPTNPQIVAWLGGIQKLLGEIQQLKAAQVGFSLVAGGVVDMNGNKVERFGPLDFTPSVEGAATLSFLREKVPRSWADLCDSVTDNFRVINPKEFRVMR